ncbi:hypothetical protein HIM_03890 [Hirsutella minnesotensis 3608]|uniref:Uncharacterized protein n=1 Tax=Hirsutella minnesotensis 3608 TaxID=1043627 RepID=A0A0F8A668_9HYPO|nr:hypothetical protein HIM_03890 [Hirsutella minnesotensis 3608]
MAERNIEMPYNHDIYHTAVRFIHDAKDTFDCYGAQNAINTVIRDCFLKYNVEKDFSACLIHRHFDLGPDERNIEEAGLATASKNFDNIYPCSWLFYKGKLFPYEFRRADLGDTAIAPPLDFVQELGSILQAKNLCDIIGLQTYSDGFVAGESTDEEAKVSTTVNYPEDVADFAGGVQASFAFFRVA